MTRTHDKEQVVSYVQQRTGASRAEAEAAYNDVQEEKETAGLGAFLLFVCLAAAGVIAMIAALIPFSLWTFPIIHGLDLLAGGQDVILEFINSSILLQILFLLFMLFVAIPGYVFGTFWLLNNWTRLTMGLKLLVPFLGRIMFIVEPFIFGYLNYMANERWFLGVFLDAEGVNAPWRGYALISVAVLGAALYFRSMLKTAAQPVTAFGNVGLSRKNRDRDLDMDLEV